METNHNGKRRRATKNGVAAAEAYAKAMAEQIKEDGAAAIALSGKDRREAIDALQMFPTQHHREEATDALEILPDPAVRRDVRTALDVLRGAIDDQRLRKPFTSPLAEAARFWFVHHPEGNSPPKLEDALLEYQNAKKHRRPETLREIHNKLSRFCRDFPNRTIVDVSARNHAPFPVAGLDGRARCGGVVGPRPAPGRS